MMQFCWTTRTLASHVAHPMKLATPGPCAHPVHSRQLLQEVTRLHKAAAYNKQQLKLGTAAMLHAYLKAPVRGSTRAVRRERSASDGCRSSSTHLSSCGSNPKTLRVSRADTQAAACASQRLVRSSCAAAPRVDRLRHRGAAGHARASSAASRPCSSAPAAPPQAQAANDRMLTRAQTPAGVRSTFVNVQRRVLALPRERLGKELPRALVHCRALLHTRVELRPRLLHVAHNNVLCEPVH